MGKLIVAAVMTVILAGCSDAEKAKSNSTNHDFKVTMFSGGQPIRTWTSKGHPEQETSASSCYFKDKETGKLVRLSGEVIAEEL